MNLRNRFVCITFAWLLPAIAFADRYGVCGPGECEGPLDLGTLLLGLVMIGLIAWVPNLDLPRIFKMIFFGTWFGGFALWLYLGFEDLYSVWWGFGWIPGFLCMGAAIYIEDMRTARRAKRVPDGKAERKNNSSHKPAKSAEIGSTEPVQTSYSEPTEDRKRRLYARFQEQARNGVDTRTLETFAVEAEREGFGLVAKSIKLRIRSIKAAEANVAQKKAISSTDTQSVKRSKSPKKANLPPAIGSHTSPESKTTLNEPGVAKRTKDGSYKVLSTPLMSGWKSALEDAWTQDRWAVYRLIHAEAKSRKYEDSPQDLASEASRSGFPGLASAIRNGRDL